MSADTTAPALTHVRFNWNNQYPNGFLHDNKQLGNGAPLKTLGFVRGAGIAIGHLVKVQKGTKKSWEGTVTAGPFTNNNGLEYWDFEVQNKTNGADPEEDDTITVTVTNPGPPAATSSPPQVSDPQPQEIP